MRLAALALVIVACGGGTTIPDASVDDAARADAGTAPIAMALTEAADPTPAATRENVTQWNWSHALATDERGGVHAVWVELATTNVEYAADFADPVDVPSLPVGRIFHRRSLDGGRTWEAATPVTVAAAGTDSANVATSGDRVFVAWRAANGDRLAVWLARSLDRGATWDAPVVVSDAPAGIGVSPPSLASATDAVSVVWADARLRMVGASTARVHEVYLARSDDGVAWGPSQSVSVADGFSSWTPSLAVAGSTVHVAWTDERDDIGECTTAGNPCHEEEYYRRSLDGGASWDEEQRLTDDPAESWAPSIAVWDQSVHLVYLDRRSGAFRNYHRRSLDGGVHWEPESLLPSPAPFANAVRPTVAVRAGHVHVAWFGFTDFEADVYWASSTDDGASWTDALDLTADAPGAARLPHVAVDTVGAAHLIWYDTRSSDASGPRVEIFYARSPS